MKNPNRLIIKDVRFSFAHVFHPDELSGKYSCRILIPKDHPQVNEIKGAIERAIADGADKLRGRKLGWTDVLHDGDLEKGDETHSGNFYLNAKSTRKPGVVKVNTSGLGGKTTEITDENEFYSGCYGHVSVGFFAFANSGNAGISVGLNNLLKTRDGDYLGGRVSAEADFNDALDEPGSQDIDDIF